MSFYATENNDSHSNIKILLKTPDISQSCHLRGLVQTICGNHNFNVTLGEVYVKDV